MKITSISIILSIAFSLCSLAGGASRKQLHYGSKTFPEDFVFGVSTAAYQIEGGWNADGKGWSMWDHLVRTDPDFITDNTNGDIAANSYYLYKRDIEKLKQLGVDIYRFSISWPRILPNGRTDYINPHGIAYYNALIDELLANGITPFVTIYHWDLPQTLSERGGWLNEETVDVFAEYARVLYKHFGDRVKHWLTINEPYIHCYQGFVMQRHAPRVNLPAIGFYECGRHLLLAHAKAYHIYQDEFKWQGGEVGIVLSMEWAYPSSDSVDDYEAVLDYFAAHLGMFMDPIFTAQGNYPQRLIDRVGNVSASQGFLASRLRPLTHQQIENIKGTADFLALNHYSSDMVYRNASVVGMYEVPSFRDDLGFGTYKDPSWPTSASPWLRENADGFYNLLVYIKEKYNNPTMYITENGFSTGMGLNDDGRVQYIRNYLNALLDARAQGVDIRGYSAWSLMDNFEWAVGYTQRFGLYEIDINDPERRRIPRKSALVYRKIIKDRVIDWEYDPDPYTEGNDASTAPIGFSTVKQFVTFTDDS
ncbi:myrosinase 1-like [Battus philenor]|uniref:myrosinase 1-like n=1 Tax=Battus philenor TaxID=42288 RepID=UPI0035D03F6C